VSPRPAIDHIRKPQILRAAAEVITERGFAATRIADVAARAGTSPPAVLYWFESREQLLTEALVADEASWGEDLDQLVAAQPSASVKLRVILEQTAIGSDLSLWIELWSRSLHDEASREARRRLDGAWRGRIAAVIAEGQGLGEFSADLEPTDAAVRIAALVDGLSVQATLGDPEVPAERVLEVGMEFAEQLLGAELREPGAIAGAA
jgi:AcrR family transcriptional regulator